MLINTSRKDRHNKLNQLLRTSDLLKQKPDIPLSKDDALFTVDTYDKFMSEMLQLQSSLNGQCGDLMYGLQQVVQQNKEVPLQLDTLWGYKPSTSYKISNRGLLQPFICHRIVHPYDYKMLRTIIIDNLDPSILADTARIGTFDVSPITAYIMKNRHYIRALTVQKNIKIMDKRCLDVLRGVIMTAQKYNVEYTLDLSRCIGIDPESLIKWLSLYSTDTCKSLGIVNMCIDITTLQYILMSQLNVNWLDVSRLTVKIDESLSKLKTPHTLIEKYLDELTLLVDFNYRELYIKELTRTLEHLNSRYINIVVNTTEAMSITTAGLYIINKLRDKNTNLYVVMDLSTFDPDNMIDIEARYGKIKGIILRNGTVKYVECNNDSISVEYQTDTGVEAILKLRLSMESQFKIINVSKLFNNLSYLITEVTDMLKLVYIDSDDVFDLDRI